MVSDTDEPLCNRLIVTSGKLPGIVGLTRIWWRHCNWKQDKSQRFVQMMHDVLSLRSSDIDLQGSSDLAEEFLGDHGAYRDRQIGSSSSSKQFILHSI